MDKPFIYDVKRVKEVKGPDCANEYLAEGWILLNIYVHGEGEYGPGEHQLYVLGWTKDEESPYEKLNG